MNRRRILLLASFVLCACASAPDVSDDRSGDATLRARVSSWWQARIAGDYRTQYELQDPAFRARTSYEGYLPEVIRRTRIPVKGFEITAIRRLADDRAEVALRVMVLLRSEQPVATDQTEIWLWRERSWFKEYQPIKTPFSLMESMQK